MVEILLLGIALGAGGTDLPAEYYIDFFFLPNRNPTTTC